MTQTTNFRQIEILLVEDNPGDARLTQEALNEGKVLNRMNVVEDGVEALAYLRKQAPYASLPRPISFCWTSTCPGWMAGKCLQ
jgi:CheY-like chemotaxis protein